MARKPRIEYAGALYHVMNRGDRRQAVFKDASPKYSMIACGWRLTQPLIMSNRIWI